MSIAKIGKIKKYIIHLDSLMEKLRNTYKAHPRSLNMRLLNYFPVLLILVLGSFLSCEKKDKLNEENFSNEKKILEVDIDGLSKIKTTIKTVHGDIVIRYYVNEAPHTSKRFIELVNQGFYDGLQFYYIEKNKVAQTGDPLNKGEPNSGSGIKLKDEFNQLKHTKGSIGMIRSSNADSADSQFYISLNTNVEYDERLTVIATVVEGQDVLDKLTQGDRMLSVFNTYE